MGISDTKLGYICKKEECIMNIYWDCPNNRRLWEHLTMYVHNTLRLEIPLEPCELLRGVMADAPEEGISNIPTLILKNNIPYTGFLLERNEWWLNTMFCPKISLIYLKYH